MTGEGERQLRGEFVRSKSELTLAEKFIALGLDYVYVLSVNLGSRSGIRISRSPMPTQDARSIGSTWG
jgi:hypothetical protein